MRVILKERVKSLGNVGDIVNVSQGYARNFLIPNRFAVIADEGNKRFVEDQQRRLAKRIKDEKNQANELRKTLNSTTIEITKRVGGNGKLFGAVTANEIVSELEKLQIETEKRWFNLEEPIKELGTFTVKAKIFTDVEAGLTLKVLMDPKQAEELKKKNEDAKKRKKEEAEQKLEAAGHENSSSEEDTESADSETKTAKKSKKQD